MNLKTIAGFRTTEEAATYAGLIEQRVAGGQHFTQETAPVAAKPAKFDM